MVVRVATPLAFKVALPSCDVPSMKVTVPVGIPAPGLTALTVAVKVTNWPTAEELADDESVVVVLAWLTIWLTIELLGPKVASASLVGTPLASVMGVLVVMV